MAYHGLVESRLRYGVIFWGNSTDKVKIIKIGIIKAQKRCIRSMFLLKMTVSFKEYNILTLPSL